MDGWMGVKSGVRDSLAKLKNVTKITIKTRPFSTLIRLILQKLLVTQLNMFDCRLFNSKHFTTTTTKL
jgi:hypothetical protein